MLKRIKRIFGKIECTLASQDGYIRILRRKGAKIGTGCYIDKFVIIPEPRLIHIGDNCRITHGTTFITHDGSIWTLRNLGLQQLYIDIGGVCDIGNNVHIGNNTIILPNVRIGDNCIIGAGAVVTKSIPDNSVAAGNPAKVIRTVKDFNEKNVNRMLKLKGLDENQRSEVLWSEFYKLETKTH